MKKKEYGKYVKAVSPKSPLLKDCAFAYAVGGGICVIGQGLIDIYTRLLELNERDAGTLCSVTLVFLAAVLTGVGVFDNIARRAGAGTLVPITGFANAVVSPALDSKSEGFVLGVGAKIFTVAGPVLLYATVSGTLWGVIYWMIKCFQS